MSDIKIRPADGGYIVTHYGEAVHTSLESVFRFLLVVFEGRASSFKGDSYGQVIIIRGEKAAADKLLDAIEAEE